MSRYLLALHIAYIKCVDVIENFSLLTSSPIFPLANIIFPTGIFGTGSLHSSPSLYHIGNPFLGTALTGFGIESITFFNSVGFLKVIKVMSIFVKSSIPTSEADMIGFVFV